MHGLEEVKLESALSLCNTNMVYNNNAAEKQTSRAMTLMQPPG